MSPEEQKEIDLINVMTHMEMAKLWRFGPVGHPYFNSTTPFYKIFKERFDNFGRITPEISKLLG